MEPRTGPGEHAPQMPQTEQWVAPGSSEYAPRSPEQFEHARPVIESPQDGSRVEVQAPPAFTGAASLPAPQSDDASGSATVTDDSPLIAGDEDVIEKEWVDRAKKIINETKDDPHQREQQIKKLQVDYLKKRYGRVIGEQTD